MSKNFALSQSNCSIAVIIIIYRQKVVAIFHLNQQLDYKTRLDGRFCCQAVAVASMHPTLLHNSELVNFDREANLLQGQLFRLEAMGPSMR